MTGKHIVLAVLCMFLFLACQKSQDKGHDHDHKGHDNAHKGHDHAHKGHDNAHKGHDHAHKGHDNAKPAEPAAAAKDSKNTLIAQTVEAGCGMCVFKMEGEKKCSLAVKIDGKPYLVEGSAMLDHGDAHSEGGMCKTARLADVEGKIVGDKFKATSFKLKPAEKK